MPKIIDKFKQKAADIKLPDQLKPSTWDIASIRSKLPERPTLPSASALAASLKSFVSSETTPAEVPLVFETIACFYP